MTDPTAEDDDPFRMDGDDMLAEYDGGDCPECGGDGCPDCHWTGEDR